MGTWEAMLCCVCGIAHVVWSWKRRSEDKIVAQPQSKALWHLHMHATCASLSLLPIGSYWGDFPIVVERVHVHIIGNCLLLYTVQILTYSWPYYNCCPWCSFCSEQACSYNHVKKQEQQEFMQVTCRMSMLMWVYGGEPLRMRYYMPIWGSKVIRKNKMETIV